MISLRRLLLWKVSETDTVDKRNLISGLWIPAGLFTMPIFPQISGCTFPPVWFDLTYSDDYVAAGQSIYDDVSNSYSSVSVITFCNELCPVIAHCKMSLSPTFSLIIRSDSNTHMLLTLWKFNIWITWKLKLSDFFSPYWYVAGTPLGNIIALHHQSSHVRLLILIVGFLSIHSYSAYSFVGFYVLWTFTGWIITSKMTKTIKYAEHILVSKRQA